MLKRLQALYKVFDPLISPLMPVSQYSIASFTVST